MARIDKLNERIRRLTHTNSYTDSATPTAQRGLQTQTLVDLMNEAHETLHAMFFDNGSDVYIKQDTLATTTGVEAVSLPSDSFLGLNVLSVEYKYGSESTQYRKLKQISMHERNTRCTGDPLTYITRENQILLGPIPGQTKSDGLRVTYEYQLPEIDVRRGKVSVVDSGTAPTSITITDKSLGDIALADSDLTGTYISVVDKDGTQQMKSIPVTSYNSSSGVITLGSFTPTAGEEVEVGDYVVIGANASTHSPFPRACEPYLVEYVKRNVLELNGDPLLNASERKLLQLQVRMESVFATWNTDIKYIPEIDSDRII